ncbi:DUF736 domain-containing protein [Limoniibacter endophyticus]|uniref:DUF736 domain-containing protein n=1 Tax=Limoniibacter endophyticus TaxID=1565040 RepID=A0A8J3DMV1_9HYPH|nr:DUF736 domain-containing protein [Limoniibacter endophyticus]GHC64860.1 hypothetical protein GCM10010136_07120 [Limoniibacter endophyticus]
MALIGQFIRTETGYSGQLRSFGLQEQLVIVPAEPSALKNAPDYRVHLDSEDGPDVGPAWKDSSENAGEFLSLKLDGPIFPFPIRARLFQSNDDPSSWGLHWKRPRKREDQE